MSFSKLCNRMVNRTFPLARRTVGAALLAAVAIVGAPGRASADCGDYVHIGTAPPAHTPESPAPRKPCHGPNCSNHTPTPAPAAPATPTTHDDPADNLPDGRDDDVRTWFAPADFDDLPVARPRAVFRPPPR